MNKKLKNSNIKFLVVGLARNCSPTIENDVLKINNALTPFGHTTWYVVESDSEDNTNEVLASLKTKLQNFDFISLGNLRQSLPKRTERLSYCRNYYLNEIRTNKFYEDIDYVVVTDLDSVNTHICEDAISSCWIRDDWDMCSANQDAPYYDIWALRHELLSPNDCWELNDFLNTITGNNQKNLIKSVFSRMIKIRQDIDWIPVESAFGGFAIYKKDVLIIGNYKGLNSNGKEVCEHVELNKILRHNGAKLFINPKLINAKYTDHTEQLRNIDYFL